MYWLLDYDEQDRIREIILRLNKKLARSHSRTQADQTFPFVGRKDRDIAVDIIEELSPENGWVCDPFAGSGTFVYAANDANRNIIANVSKLLHHSGKLSIACTYDGLTKIRRSGKVILSGIFI